MAQARKGNVSSSKLSVLLLGEAGSCKSEKALEMTLLKRPDGKPFRVLYIDVENGSVDDRLERFRNELNVNLDNLYIVYTQSVTEVLEYIGYARDNVPMYELDENGNQTSNVVLDADGNPFIPDGIVIDGMALLYSSKKMSLLETSKMRAKLRVADKKLTGAKALVTMTDVKFEYSDHEQANNEGARIVLALVGSGKHFVITSFAKEEKEEVKTGELDSFGNPKKVKTGNYLPDAFKGLIEYCKTVIVLKSDEDYNITAFVQKKDRTETFVPNKEIENFSLTQFQNVVNRGGDFVVKYNFDSNIKKDAETEISQQNPFAETAVKQSNSVGNNTQTENKEDEVLALQNECVRILNLAQDDKAKSELIAKLTRAGCTQGIRKATNVDDLKKYIEILTKSIK